MTPPDGIVAREPEAHGPVNGIGCGCAICVCEELRKRLRHERALIKRSREEQFVLLGRVSTAWLTADSVLGDVEDILDEVMCGKRTATGPL